MRKMSPKRMRILKTANAYLCFFLVGLCIAVPGPCLLDLKHLVQTDIQHIGFIFTARSVGYFLGSICGGILLDAVKSKQAVMTVGNFVVSVTMLAIPWSRNLGTLAGFMVVNGMTLGTVDIGGNVVCLTLWGGDSGPYYQALHFTFGLGGLVAPLIAAPFLGNYDEHDKNLAWNLDNATYFNNYTIEAAGANGSLSVLDNGMLYPFSIIGVFGLLVTFLFGAVCLLSPFEEHGARDRGSRNSKEGVGFLSAVIFLNFLLMFVETGTEVGYAQMLTTYVVKSRHQLSSSTGSYMTSTFWAAFTAARLVSIFLAMKVSNFTLIVYDLLISVAGSLVLLFFASHVWSLWLASVLLGVGIASFFPAAVAWLDTYIDVTNKIASAFRLGAAFGEMVIPFTISYFIDRIPEVLLYVVPISCISCTFVVFILHLILRKKEKKHAGNKEPGCIAVNSSARENACSEYI